MTEIPQIQIIIGLLLAISVFYSFGYVRAIEKKEKRITIKKAMFKYSLLFLFGIVSICLYLLKNCPLGNLFFGLFMVSLIVILINWIIFSVRPEVEKHQAKLEKDIVKKSENYPYRERFNDTCKAIWHHRIYFIFLIVFLIIFFLFYEQS